MEITIDQNSGYCFGVEFAIQMAEDELSDSGHLYCLGDIVHNTMEVRRLHELGLEIIDHDDLKQLKNTKVLIRAHGEPPETYKIALENNIELIDASCPVVLKLQNRVNKDFRKMEEAGGQLVIYGKKGHAEVVGLTGQTNNKALVVMEDEDLEMINYEKPIVLYSQTTKSTTGFYGLKAKIEEKISSDSTDRIDFKANDSICRQVSNREPNLKRFATENDVILFVSGKKSSNGKALYSVCQQVNERSYFIENEDDLQAAWFNKDDKVGICGATSTPTWLMKKVKEKLSEANYQIH
jgi:4-hydroxy-3-methylbut-2-en-1-yl diphosphate reductase